MGKMKFRLKLENGLELRIRRCPNGRNWLLLYAYYLGDKPLCKFTRTSVEALAAKAKTTPLKMAYYLGYNVVDNPFTRCRFSELRATV